MKIYSMTATFGKLSHRTLELQPGLNIIKAPNEWGKSTWCAFMIAMLYGINTREQTKTGFLADKEHYTPWSGEPMSGRMDLNWGGRDITIERRNKGRGFFNDFKAYETHSGIPVEELTAANCGQVLLGVEQSVFTRAGFLRQTDMPVTADDKLRSRLNALVTTGEENTDADDLAQKLKELKNRCRFNKTGLLPQAEQERKDLQDKLDRLESLHSRVETIVIRQRELKKYRADLENHRAALEYAAYSDYARQVQEAKIQETAAQKQAVSLEARCKGIPSSAAAAEELAKLRRLRDERDDLHRQVRLMPPVPQKPEVPEPFRGIEPEEAVRWAQHSEKLYEEDRNVLNRGGRWLPVLPAVAGIALLAVFFRQWWGILAGVLLIGGALLWIRSVTADKRRRENTLHALEQQYHPLRPGEWSAAACRYAREQEAYALELEQYREKVAALESAMQDVNQRIAVFAGEGPVSDRELQLQRIINLWDDMEEARREVKRARELTAALESACKEVPPPQYPDELTFTPAQTERAIAQVGVEQEQHLAQLGQCQGQIEALGQKESILRQVEKVQQRIDKLENMYNAAVYAMQVQQAASEELQRRFAPRIASRAQQILGRLTGGRYDRLMLDRDLQLSSGAQGEDTLRDSLWRSSGTTDQLYLALRLAVAEELTPDAPMVLDDALVRFDEGRMSAALEILQEAAHNKQVILFTCQDRELAWYEKTKEEAL